ncbi:unnamed protein product [Polarella glacialis]|uniref:Uncharacterized protein n=1 Tax=Polarella glacialis TaxID=89957 RepID=A0A813JAQ8_POLGL|nr:unnamed protein product [Polarella glacialis]
MGFVNQQENQQFYRKHEGEFVTYVWPADRRYSTKACGVIIAFRRKLIPTTAVTEVHSPPAHLAGRGGAVRVKLRSAGDFLITDMYMAPVSAPNALELNRQLWSWHEQLLATLPARCLPITLLDANARLGSQVLALPDERGHKALQ